jgi:TonB family protein
MNELIQTLNARAPDILRTLALMEAQIAMLALLVLAIERLLRQPLPKLRYALWLVVLAKCLLPPFVPAPQAVQLPIAQLELPAILIGAASPQTQTFSRATIFLIFWLAASLVLGVVALRRYWLLRSQLHNAQLVKLSEIGDKNGFSWPPIWNARHLSTPVAIGLFRPRIYLTNAITKAERTALQAVLYHELAHVLRRDGWIVLLQTLAQILHPFNPLVWLMNLRLSRYREEICDDFALQNSNVPPRQYGEILLRFLENNAISPFAPPAGTCFFETANGFKQRFKYLLTPKEVIMTRFIWKHQLLLAGMVVALLAASWQCSRHLSAPTAPSEEKLVATTPPPDFVEYDKAPAVIKRGFPQYPELAKAAGVEGTVYVKIWIREDGKVEMAKLQKGSGTDAGFEEAALQAATQFEFHPAMKNGKPVAVWVSIPFHFKLGEKSASPETPAAVRSAAPNTNEAPQTGFVQFDEAPQIVRRAAPVYPEIAKRAGIEGTVWVKIQLDENGKVREALVQKSSTPDLGFEEAAMAAAKSFEFSPARKNQQPVAVWVTIPFHFKLSQIEKMDQNR